LISTAKVHNVKQRAVASMFRVIRIRRVKLEIIGVHQIFIAALSQQECHHECHHRHR
jgi:hypothetical protein